MKSLFLRLRGYITRRRAIIALCVLLAGSTIRVRAQIIPPIIPGLPQLVFDPTVFGKIGEELVQVLQIVTATAATATQLQTDARYLTNKYVFRGSIMATLGNYLHPTPVTQPWAQTVRTGLNAAQGYGQAAVTLKNNPAMVMMNDTRTPFYATAQIAAANNTRALEALGAATKVQADMEPAIKACENASLSEAPDDNTRAAQQNIATRCSVIALHEQQAALSLANARMGVELAASKLQADTQAEHLNNYTDADNSRLVRPSELIGLDQTLNTAEIH